MDSSNMRNLALVLAVVAAPTAASAADQNTIVPAIIPSAHAATVNTTAGIAAGRRPQSTTTARDASDNGRGSAVRAV